MKRFIIATLLLIVVVAICGGLIWFNFFRDKMIGQFFANMKAPVVTVSAIEVKPQTWTPGIEAVGTAAASEGVDIAVQASGIVQTIAFKANDRVTQGELLVQLDDSVERAGLISAQTNVAVAQDAVTRTQALLNRNVSTVATLQDSQNNLDKAKGALAELEATLDHKAVKAPFAGTIGIPRIDVGQYVQPGTLVATLQNLDTMKVNFTIPEQQLTQLKIGQTAKFGLTEDDLRFTGKITGIDPKIDPSSRLVSVQALVDNSAGILRPGQFIRVRVDLPQEDNVIALPQTAVTISLYGAYVYVVQDAPPPAAPATPAPDAAAKPADGAAKPAEAPAAPSLIAKQQFVTLGRRSGDLVEIVKGVEPGMQIVTSGQNKLSSGSSVAIDNSVQPISDAAAKTGASKS
ncbi:efflux RND transporter periplasmic adaptor subunit [Kaistia dalseonensis]|uniref:Membrane fusion protein (Multidrug efflux system) n=1 Tax=Kaistia dalseonensis TaxID=410840 RepID=A0ABU0HB30_9HYPH|nr:efflux RND transporter periplasmic adaptor subunit [Kaistia dalseonensis]MCX5496898.1 efflux RND transporter periplasmic adaptor subunit [Kaistia dalseonensis]MDQ0439524.1 membrane fusion protein (multidrug efflux system) [Kaistia dalseonensis]